MTKIQDIDVAFIETLKKHPNFSENISSILYKNAVEEVYPTNFTSTNMARTRVRRLDNKDFIEYIIKNAVIIYSAYQKLHDPNRHTRNTSWYDESSFPNISEIVKEMEIITNPKINAILYYSANPNQLFVLADAVAKTRFNPKWYSNGTTFIPDPLEKGAEFRYQLDTVGTPNAKELLAKIDHDVAVVKPMTKVNINYEAVNRCLQEVAMGTQVQYARNEYALDGTLYATQDVGKKRSNQEDSVIILTHPDNPDFKFLAVSDGMGGLAAGEVASNYVVKSLAEWFKTVPADAYYFPSGLKESFAQAIKKINDDIYNKYHTEAGATLVGAIVTEQDTIIANVGDSRAYAVTDTSISLLTSDESYVWNQAVVKNGGQKPSPEQIDDFRFNPNNNKITGYMGQPNMTRVQTLTIPNYTYKTLLLLSDGVTDLLSQDDIRIIAQNTPRSEITRALVERALTYDAVKRAKFIGEASRVVSAGKDNASAAMFRR